jgi:hypothetical protein
MSNCDCPGCRPPPPKLRLVGDVPLSRAPCNCGTMVEWTRNEITRTARPAAHKAPDGRACPWLAQ